MTAGIMLIGSTIAMLTVFAVDAVQKRKDHPRRK
jgi:hypothetical protein